MKKRIAFISEHASPLASPGSIDCGGQNVYVAQLAKHLVDLGYNVDIFTRSDDTTLPEIVLWDKGIRVINIGAGPKHYIPKEELLPYMDEFAENLRAFIEEHGRYDLLHANFWMSGYVATKIKRDLGIPYVVTFHALGKVRRQYQGRNDLFPDSRFKVEEDVIRDADQVIAECPQDKEDLITLYRGDQDKITTIPCGFDPEEFYPVDQKVARAKLGLPNTQKIVLQLGRMVPRKGVATVIEALGVLKKQKQKVPLLLIVGGEVSCSSFGREANELARLKRDADALGITNNIKFLGQKSRDQLTYYYSAADVFVSTPWYEPFGITPLEAMACATPVIGSAVGGIKLTVVDNGTGFLVPPKDPTSLAKRIKDITENDSLAASLGQNGYKRVHAFFTWKTVAQAMATLYETVMQKTTFPMLNYPSRQIIEANIDALIMTLADTKALIPLLAKVSSVVADALENGKKILTCGNGGSAADAQHLVAELVGHFQHPSRNGLSALSLTSDSIVTTAVANDFGFDEVFARQVDSFGQPGDVLIAISTSGSSENVRRAVQRAQKKGILCIGILGRDGGSIASLCDIPLIVPSSDTQRIQEVHTHLIHTMCELVEKQLFEEKPTELSFGKTSTGMRNYASSNVQDKEK